MLLQLRTKELLALAANLPASAPEVSRPVASRSLAARLLSGMIAHADALAGQLHRQPRGQASLLLDQGLAPGRSSPLVPLLPRFLCTGIIAQARVLHRIAALLLER